MSNLHEVAGFIREMKAAGATQVRVGDVEVSFGPEFAEPEPERKPTKEELEKAHERVRYLHTEG